MKFFQKREEQLKERETADRISHDLFRFTEREGEIISAMQDPDADYALLQLKAEFLLNDIKEEIRRLPPEAKTGAESQQKKLMELLLERVASHREFLITAGEKKAMGKKLSAFAGETEGQTRFQKALAELSEDK